MNTMYSRSVTPSSPNPTFPSKPSAIPQFFRSLPQTRCIHISTADICRSSNTCGNGREAASFARAAVSHGRRPPKRCWTRVYPQSAIKDRTSRIVQVYGRGKNRVIQKKRTNLPSQCLPVNDLYFVRVFSVRKRSREVVRSSDTFRNYNKMFVVEISI